MDESKISVEEELLLITRKFLQESGATRAEKIVTLQAHLEKELGVGSIERAELFHRIEDYFDVHLPEKAFSSVNTLLDIRNALLHLPEIASRLPHKKETLLQSATTIHPENCHTLLEIFELYAQQEPQRHYVYLQGEDKEEIITYGSLYKIAKKVAAGLQARGVTAGDTVAIMLPTSKEFFYAYFAILLCGAIAVPIYPPMRPDQIEEYAYKEARILHNAGIKILISFKEARYLNKILQPFVPTLKMTISVAALIKNSAPFHAVEVEADDIALLQYTSGSTGDPKGVVLTHSNLLANIRAYGEGIGILPNDMVVSWLPLYHDMGLIGAVLGSFYYGAPLILMSPLTFLSRPEKWLWAIHYRRATLSAAPNFAYELCVKRIRDKDIESLDLSSWRLAFNGAEAVHPQTLEDFYQRFSKYGFKKNAIFPVFGLAECSVALTFPPLEREPHIDVVDQKHFEFERKAIPVTKQTKKSYRFVGCGFALKNHEIRVVDENNNLLPDREIGRLQFRGPSAMRGYFRNSEATSAIYHNGWWDTGDLAYLVEGELFITGRSKDLIIKAGRNYYPPEIEEAVCEVEGVRSGCVAAIGVTDAETGTEKLVVIVEVKTGIALSNRELSNKISLAIQDRITIPPDEIVLVPAKSIPKTSSGKLRRSSAKLLYQNKKLSKPSKSVLWQVAKLTFIGFGKKIARFFINALKIIYTLYLSILVLVSYLPIRLILAFLREMNAVRVIRVWAKIVLRLGFCRLKVNGKKNLALYKQQIFLANHASYIDAVVLIAALPVNCRYVAKVELGEVPVLGALLKKLGCIFVDRFDVVRSQADLLKVEEKIQQGCSVIFFPEGTFTAVPGIRPFKLGPFQLAQKIKLAVCPIAISGARKILRGDTCLLAPGKVRLEILSPRFIESDDWKEIVSVRDWARQTIADHSEEKPIDLIAAGPEA